MEKKFLICALQAEFLAILGLVLLMTLFWALPVEAGVSQRCARLVPTGGREVIINECATCRIVNIIRKRPGNSAPFTRSYNVQPNTTFPVPFRGPGRSRVTSVRACKGGIGAAVVFAARDLLDAELPQVIGDELHVEQQEAAEAQPRHQVDQGHLAGVGGAREHAFAEERPL